MLDGHNMNKRAIDLIKVTTSFISKKKLLFIALVDELQRK